MSESNIAIIIAVSDYQQIARLPACKNDGSLIRDILQQTGRFAPENVFYADQKTDSATVKADLSKFIKGLSSQQVQEAFFYYSGHGTCDGTKFYYLLSDYDEGKLNQTTLSNTELDGMLRTLSPGLAVKVVDACHSGTHYVKSSEDIEKALRRSSEGQIKKCYFMFSSEQHQQSWQDDRLSFFTRSFARALVEYKGHPVRYKDIIAYISDQFGNNTHQKPVFITQAGFTEVFAEPVRALAQLLDSKSALLIEKEITEAAGPGTTTTTTLPPVLSLAERLRQRIMEEAAHFLYRGRGQHCIQ